jgi:hypothetical protein
MARGRFLRDYQSPPPPGRVPTTARHDCKLPASGELAGEVAHHSSLAVFRELLWVVVGTLPAISTPAIGYVVCAVSHPWPLRVGCYRRPGLIDAAQTGLKILERLSIQEGNFSGIITDDSAGARPARRWAALGVCRPQGPAGALAGHAPALARCAAGVHAAADTTPLWPPSGPPGRRPARGIQAGSPRPRGCRHGVAVSVSLPSRHRVVRLELGP